MRAALWPAGLPESRAAAPATLPPATRAPARGNRKCLGPHIPPNLSDEPDARLPLLTIPLPRFRQPRPPDPPLPEVTVDPDPETEPRPPASPDLLQLPTHTPGRLPPLDPSPAPPAPTRTFSAGDLKVAGEVVAGILALVCGYAAWMLGRRGLSFRQPTQTQLDNVATPVGAIVARHVPTEFISRDLVDGTRAAGALHSYLIDGPLVERPPAPMLDLEDQ